MVLFCLLVLFCVCVCFLLLLLSFSIDDDDKVIYHDDVMIVARSLLVQLEGKG